MRTKSLRDALSNLAEEAAELAAAAARAINRPTRWPHIDPEETFADLEKQYGDVLLVWPEVVAHRRRLKKATKSVA